MASLKRKLLTRPEYTKTFPEGAQQRVDEMWLRLRHKASQRKLLLLEFENRMKVKRQAYRMGKTGSFQQLYVLRQLRKKFELFSRP